MNFSKIRVILLICFLIGVIGVVSSAEIDSSPEQRKTVAEEDLVEVSSKDPEDNSLPSDFIKVPTRPFKVGDGELHLTWGPLLQLKEVYYPVFPSEEYKKLTPDNPRKLTNEQLRPNVLLVQANFQGRLEKFNVFYTDSRILVPNILLGKKTPRDYMEYILYDSNTVGVAFNPYSRVMKHDLGDITYINKVGVAELVGLLEIGTDEPQGRPYHELTLQAWAEDKPYQALYYWAKSYRSPRSGDDWKKGYLAKLKAYHKLDYPGSRARAISELQWFIGEHGSNPERSKLLRQWKTEA